MPQTPGNGISETLNSNIFWLSMPQDLPRISHVFSTRPPHFEKPSAMPALYIQQNRNNPSISFSTLYIKSLLKMISDFKIIETYIKLPRNYKLWSLKLEIFNLIKFQLEIKFQVKYTCTCSCNISRAYTVHSHISLTINVIRITK